MSAITLYWYPGTCARVALVALEEIGAPFDVHVVDRDGGEDRGAAYRALNPKGKVPTLVIDGRPITENPAIQTYLARLHPEAGLLPTGDLAVEIDALSTMVWFAAGVHPMITRLRLPRLFSDNAEAFDGIRAVARRQLEDAFAILERRLTDQPWLYGGWSIVDAYMLWLWFRATGSGMDGSPFPRCADHCRRTEQRPSVVRALDREEREMERIVAIHGTPEWMPPYRVGRAPATDATSGQSGAVELDGNAEQDHGGRSP
jgi:glutathione S-transferase